MKKRQITRAAAVTAAVVAVATVATARAADLYWQGGAGDLGSANYTSVTTDTSTTPPTVTTATNVAPTATDYVYIGGGGSTTNAADLTLGRLRLGHNSTAGQPTAQPGDGSLAVSAGTLSLGGTTTGGIDSGLLVGYNAPGSLTITGGAVTTQFFGKVGYADAAGVSGSGSVTVSNNGALTISARGLSIGEGLPGSLTLSDTAALKVLNGSNGNLVVGNTSTGTFTQTGGSTDVRNATFVGRNATVSSTMSITGGTFASPGITVADGTAGNTSATFGGTSALSLSGAINVGGGSATDTSLMIGSSTNVSSSGGLNVGSGAGAARTTVTITDSAVVSVGGIAVGSGSSATDSSLTISGNAQVTGSAGLNVGSGATTTNSTATINGNAVVNLRNGMTVGLNADPNAVLNVGGNAAITLANSGNSDVHFFIGRGSSTTTFNMTGGSITAPNYVLIGTASSPDAKITINHSGGTIVAGTNTNPVGPPPVPPATTVTVRVGFKVGDTNGTSTYNLSGTGAINVANGLMIVGRQGGSATFNQTGGTVTASGGLHVGEAETATATLQTGTGTYVVSGGTINASVPTGSTVAALAVGNADTGTLRIVGGDAAINVTGNVLVNTGAAVDPTPARVGTLAYRLEAGEGLTKINATGTATFSAGSVLSFDVNGVATPAASYDLMTAADVVNGGLVLSAPAGWHVDLVDGVTAKTLQILQAINGDANRNGKIDADDYALIDRGAALQAQWWHNGDFNDSGVIDSQDYLLIDTALGQQNGGHLSPGFLATRESQFGAGYVADLVAAVPEPGSLSVLAAGLLPLVGRRRRGTR